MGEAVSAKMAPVTTEQVHSLSSSNGHNIFVVDTCISSSCQQSASHVYACICHHMPQIYSTTNQKVSPMSLSTSVNRETVTLPTVNAEWAIFLCHPAICHAHTHPHSWHWEYLLVRLHLNVVLWYEAVPAILLRLVPVLVLLRVQHLYHSEIHTWLNTLAYCQYRLTATGIRFKVRETLQWVQ